jgi:membrane-bound lytic murein transglycosylase D
MKRASQFVVVAVALAALLAGCEDSAKRPVHVSPPAQTPAPELALIRNLPLARGPITPLTFKPEPAMVALLAKAGASFDAGEAAYKTGNLDAAREDFDRAVDLILASGYSVDSDPRLKALFDHIVETVHRYELEAAQESAGSEPAGETAPIEEIADLELPAGNPALALKASQELIAVAHDLPLTLNDYVLSYLSYFQTPRGRAIVETGLRRAGRYHDMIRGIFAEEGLPQDLIYLAQAESAFKPRAVSRAGARGIWQFMPFRGQEYGLERTHWVDDRSDPEKATRAAAHHLRDLYHMFGDWYLVMAAYNSGPLNVIKAIERTGYADFWELHKRNALPQQTRNYVPIILALTMVAKDPARYGVHVEPEAPPRFDVVRPGHPIDLRLVADAVGDSLDDLQSLNPQLLRSVTPTDPGFELRLPVGTAAAFRDSIAAVPPEKWLSWRLHHVSAGETLADIARRYHVSPVAVAQANRLDAGDPLERGQSLVIPANPSAQGRLIHYVVRRGDTLEGIAGQFDITVEELKHWNRIRGDRAPRGARLKIYVGGEPPAPSQPSRVSASRADQGHVKRATQSAEPSVESQHHVVKAGETLYSIARAYRTTVEALRRANPFLAGRSLEVGDLLTILPTR